MRTNLSDIKALCKTICNTCYVDTDVAETLLMSKGIDPAGGATGEFSSDIVSLALTIVRGWVETSRSEGGISVSTSVEQINKNISFWCNKYGLDAEEFLAGSVTVIRDGSNLW